MNELDKALVEQLAQILSTLNYKKGTYTSITYVSDLGNGVYKLSKSCVRLGATLPKVDNIERDTQQRISFDHKLNCYVIYNEKSEKTKMFILTTNNPRHKSKSKYYHNGKEVSIDYLLDNKLVTPSRLIRKSSSPLKCFTPELKNILSIGGIEFNPNPIF